MRKIVFILLSVVFVFGYDELKIKGSTQCEATLVVHDTGKAKAVLFIHGYNDYFFHEHLSKRFIEEGYDFYALDLHGYGRSIECEKSYNITDISEYFAELTSAIQNIRQRGVKDLTLLAHSQGGLMSTLYSKTHNNFERLILNAPFFEVYSTPFVVNILKPFGGWIGGLFHDIRLPSLESLGQYNKDLYKRWHFDPSKKKIPSDGLYLGYLNAINRAQQEIRLGVKFSIPTLIMSSDKNGDLHNTEDIKTSDTVVSIKAIQEFVQNSQGDITYIPIKDAQHDIFLSYPAPLSDAIESMMDWLKDK